MTKRKHIEPAASNPLPEEAAARPPLGSRGVGRGLPNPDDPRKSRMLSEPHMKRIGGSGIARWDEGLLLRTMHTVRPPILREGETQEEAKTDFAGLAGVGLEAFAPQDAVEAMIAAQALALHFAAMECAKRAMLPQQPADVASRLRKDTANLSRAMVDMTEALQRRRGKGPQTIRVERVVVQDGGQAVVAGSVVTSGTSALSSPPPQQTIGQGRPPLATGDALPVIADDVRGEGE